MAPTPPPLDRGPPLSATSSTFDLDDSPCPSPSTNRSRVTSVIGQRGSLGVASGSAQVTPAYLPRRVSHVRPSFSTMRRVSRVPTLDDEGDGPKLPTLVPGIRPAYSTPLPVLPMLVLCIAMLSELLSANLSQPFMLRMVEGFFIAEGRTPDHDMEAQVGLWTGNLVSVFYITQFFTSLLWSSIADRHGRRAVLVASMCGSGLALLMFGTSTSLPEAICVRLIQGIFGGAIGVFRGSVRDITDETNATRAYALLGFCWGLGGVVGPIIGGVFESPAFNYPNTFFGRIEIFKRLPYFLPTLLGGIIMFVGAILACFLSWDGGVRGGSRIQLEVEKDEPLVPSRLDTVSPPRTEHRPSAASAVRIHPSRLFSPNNADESEAPMASSFKLRRESLASLGTAYGYGGIRSKHPTLAARRAIEAARRASAAERRRAGDEVEQENNRNVSFATKLLLANEDNTFNINDLWLSAAVAQDTAVFDDDDEYDEDAEYLDSRIDLDDDDDRESLAPTEADDTIAGGPGSPGSPRRGVPLTRTMSSVRSGARHRVASNASEIHRLIRRQSAASRRQSVSSNVVPSIFANTGLQSTAYDVDDTPSTPADPFSPPGTIRRANAPAPLTAIQEGNVAGASPRSDTGTMVEKPPTSRWKLLPLLLICQYGLLSCHDSTHGQIFLSFVVTPYKSGGVGITPAHYSVLVAIMCVGQLVYQFYLFPRLGPPLGRFNHLQMFRLGTALFVPGYLLVPLIHLFASPNKSGGFLVMLVMSLISAIRYCGGTFAYTSVMILINAMTPPHLIGLANGLAQSIVSCARFFGPALGGAIWSASINGNPAGYPKGFFTVAIFAAVQVLGTLFIR